MHDSLENVQDLLKVFLSFLLFVFSNTLLDLFADDLPLSAVFLILGQD